MKGERLRGKRLVKCEKSCWEVRRWGGKRGYRRLVKDAEKRRRQGGKREQASGRKMKGSGQDRSKESGREKEGGDQRQERVIETD